MQTNVYIDGFNLYYGAVRRTPYKWLNPQALVSMLLPDVSIRRIRYFTAPIKSRKGNPDAPSRQQVYLRALRTIPAVSIIEGKFKDREGQYPQYPFAYGAKDDAGIASPLKTQTVRSEEKGTDVNIAAHLLMDCFNGEYDRAVVVSNDSDLALPIRMVRDDFKKEVVVVNPQRGAREGVWEMRRASTRVVSRINGSLLAKCQFPDQLADGQGAFSKPLSW